ncbi:MAG: hypothetical protein HOP13_05025 [Alphaproteobacteria bacterium]|nr:hypothetical protein [Alphaproteobacteria bacterium]
MSKYASLTAGILARKGEAEPTATPFADQMLTRVGCPAPEIEGLTPMRGSLNLHAESSRPKTQALKPPPVKPLDPFGSFGRRPMEAKVHVMPLPVPAAADDDEEQTDNHCLACPGPSPEEAGKTYHVNLRLKRMRFVKLKLSSALLRRPVQEIVAEALDRWFETLPGDVLGDCACLKARCD